MPVTGRVSKIPFEGRLITPKALFSRNMKPQIWDTGFCIPIATVNFVFLTFSPG